MINAVAPGLRAHGHQVTIRESTRFPSGDESSFDLGAVWGDTLGAIEICEQGPSLWKHTLQIDNGYLNRKRYEGHYGLTWGGQRQCHEYLWTLPRCPERFIALNETIKSWRTEGNTIIILAPSEKQAKLCRFDLMPWVDGLKAKLADLTKKRVIARIKQYQVTEPLRDVLANPKIFAAIGYNTKGVCDCLLEGIPIFPMARCAAEQMGLRDMSRIETPWYPDNRLDFFERLAGTQWLLSEITAGVPFRAEYVPTL